MARLEDLTKGALVRGVLAERAVKVVDVDWHGSSAVTLTYTDDSTGKPNQELLYRDDESRLTVDQAGRAWSMDGDGALFRLVSEAKRYKLGRLAGSVTRHLLLMTATPHAGIEEDFQLFLAPLDADRFEGKPRDASHSIDTSDLMRRLVKEKLLRFDGTRLFPEHRSYTAIYPLSDGEALLYKRVTEYVQEEMNRAERLKGEGEGRRGAVVGFALTTLQRRLASSPEAIYQSLTRRRHRLENRIAEERTRKRGAELGTPRVPDEFRDLDEDFDADDLPDGELEELEEELVDQASAARTIAELEAERQLAPLPPVVAGGALVIPGGLLTSLSGIPAEEIADHARERSMTERAAIDAVLACERQLGRGPKEMPPNSKSYDIESRDAEGMLWFIEVKGRIASVEIFTVTRSEIGVGRNKPNHHVLALVEVGHAIGPQVRYLRRAFEEVGDLPFETISVNLKWRPYFERGEIPA